MNRRTFLTTAGAASLAPLILTSRKSTAQTGTLDPNLIQACSDSHAAAIANMWAGTPTLQDWNDVIAAHTDLRTAVLASGVDAPFSGSVPDSVDPSAFDPGPATQYMQRLCPGFQASDLGYNLLADPATIAQACQLWQATGLSGGCSSAINQARVMKQAIQAQQGGGYAFGGFRPKAYTCAEDGAAIFVVSTALVVLTVMTGPAAVLAMAFWEGVVLWGGIGAGVWATGHSMFCAF